METTFVLLFLALIFFVWFSLKDRFSGDTRDSDRRRWPRGWRRPGWRGGPGWRDGPGGWRDNRDGWRDNQDWAAWWGEQ